MVTNEAIHEINNAPILGAFTIGGKHMKKFYYIIDINDNDKCYAYVAKINENINLKQSQHFTQENIVSITQCSTLKQARAIVEAQNFMYKAANIYMFDDEPLF